MGLDDLTFNTSKIQTLPFCRDLNVYINSSTLGALSVPSDSREEFIRAVIWGLPYLFHLWLLK